MIMLCIYDTIYVLLNILLFALPKMWTMYEESGIHYYVLPKAIPFGKKNKIQRVGYIFITNYDTIITYISGLIMDNCINYSPNCTYRFHLLHIGHHRGTLSHRLSSLFRYISSMVIKKIHNTYCDIFVGKFYHMSTVAT